MPYRVCRGRSLHKCAEYTFHVYGRSEGICGIIITDQEYPALVAHQLLSKVCDEFLAKYPRSAFANATTLPFPELKEYVSKYQDPQQADSIMKIQKELDETKIVLHKTIESVLERGEKIDNLVAKSDGLSAQSKMFYTQVCTPHEMGVSREWPLLTCRRVGEEAELLLRRHVKRLWLHFRFPLAFIVYMICRDAAHNYCIPSNEVPYLKIYKPQPVPNQSDLKYIWKLQKPLPSLLLEVFLWLIEFSNNSASAHFDSRFTQCTMKFEKCGAHYATTSNSLHERLHAIARNG